MLGTSRFVQSRTSSSDHFRNASVKRPMFISQLLDWIGSMLRCLLLGLLVPSHAVTDPGAELPFRALRRLVDAPPERRQPHGYPLDGLRFEAVGADVRDAALDRRL